jgi:hypothetical protein
VIGRIRLGQSGYHSFHALAPMVAREMNLFVDEGLVNSSGMPAIETLAASICPFNAEKVALAQRFKENAANAAPDVKPSTVVYLNRRGARLRIVGGWLNRHSGWLVGRQNVRQLGDLRGRIIGLKDLGSTSHDTLAYHLKQAGLDPRDAVHYQQGVTQGSESLRTGQVDATLVGPEDGAALLDEGFNLLLDLAQLYPQGRPERVLVVTEELLEERPEWVASFVRGMIRAYWLMRTMPDNFFYVHQLERRMRLRPVLDAGVPLPNPDTTGNDRRARMRSFDPDEPQVRPICRSPERCERLPLPIDGQPAPFGAYFDELVEIGELERADLETLDDSVRLDIARDAFQNLAGRAELADELRRAREVAERVGY